MSNSEIRVVPGPANYFSHPGSLQRLSDFFNADQLSRAVWVYGERALAGAEPFCRRPSTCRRQKRSALPATAANAMWRRWRRPQVTIGR